MPRTLESKLLQALLRTKQEALAQAIGKDISTVSRIGSGEIGIKLKDLQIFLDALGFKVVRKRMACMDEEVMNAYLVLARRALTNPESLRCDDE